MSFLTILKNKIMKRFLFFFFLCGSFAFAQEKQPETILKGFSHPESVVYDKARQQYYVSNIGAEDGFISRVSKNDKVEEHHWITGLNNPKGLLIHGNSLFVTDVTELVEIDIESGKITSRIPVEGSKSLNDPAKDEAGNIYFSDLSKGSIFVLRPTGEVEEWLHSEKLEQPNGLFVTSDHILVAGWGKDEPGHFLKVNRNTKEIERISHSGIGNLDGIQKIKDGQYYISDWGSGKIYSITMDGELKEVLTTAKSSGDIYYHNEDQKLYVPMNRQNELWIYSMK